MGEGYSFSADYWSLGVCLYEFVCGVVPFGESCEDPLEIYKSIIEDEVEFPKFIKDEEYIDFNLKLLSKKPYDRLTSLNTVISHPWFASFDVEKLKNMSQKAPYCPKLKNNIKLKTIPYEEFLQKSYASDFKQFEDKKYHEEETWFKEL